MKILIGYDGSADSEGALQDLQAAGLPAKASVLVATVTVPWVSYGTEGLIPLGVSAPLADYSMEALKQARLLAEQAAASICTRFPHWKVKAEATIHEPAFGLLEQAEKWKPNLIVLGSHGRTALSRLLMGSVSQNVLHHAAADVRVTRPRIRGRVGPPRILVGVDGSRGSKSAVAAVAARTWPPKTEIHVMGVLGYSQKLGGIPLGMDQAYWTGLMKARRLHLETAVENAIRDLAQSGWEAEGAVVSGDARAVLVKEAKAWGADCVFLGCRGLGSVDRFLMGSVSSVVASHAPCTVEIIRKGRPSRRKS